MALTLPHPRQADPPRVDFASSRRGCARAVAWAALLALLPGVCLSGERAHMAALTSIRADEALAHLEVLASDAMEGRRGGSRGGRAAATYVVDQLKRDGWSGGAASGDFYQSFPGGGRNILAVREGTDEQLKNQYIVIGAHYDHVGYGDRRTSFGPIGQIHNGADDNASGVSCLLEFAQAVAQHNVSTRRSLLIAFWDSEELGLLGSQHWCNNPTVPLSQTPLYLNIDMVGRLREGRIELLGSRSGYGLRKLAATAIDPGVWIDFSWELEPNGDHWNFLTHRVPSLMLHTGLHDDYHRPSDDVGLINPEGVQLVSRYLFDLALTAADVDELPKFRRDCFRENKRMQAHRERTLPALSPDAPRPRVGLSWRADPSEPRSIYLTRIVPDTPAASAGLKPLDRVLRISGQTFEGTDGFQEILNQELSTESPEIALRVERDGRVGEYVVKVE